MPITNRADDVVSSWKSEDVFQKLSSGMLDESEPKRKSNLQALLDARELTHRELSAKTGLTERTIGALTSGSSLPRLDNALSIAKALNISLKTLCRELGLEVDDIPDD